MTAISHYIEVAAAGGAAGSSGPGSQYAVAGAVAEVVHLVNSEAKAASKPNLGMGFPMLGEDHRLPMAMVRVFGTRESLQPVVERIRSALSATGASVSGLRPVPDAEDVSWRVYIRDRLAEREAPGFVERSLLRAQRKHMARAATGVAMQSRPRGSEEREEMRLARRAVGQHYARAFLKTRSRTNGKDFSLFVRLHDSNQQGTGVFNGYGLSTKETPSAVPHF